MNRLNLRPWETPPEAEVIPVSVSHCGRRCKGAASEWTLGLLKVPACRRPLLWVRPRHDSCEAGFVAYEITYHQTRHFDADTERFALRLAFAHLWDKNLFARLFFLNEEGQLRGEGEVACEAILVAPNGIAAWSLATVSLEVHDASTFQWSTPLSNSTFFSLPARELWERIQTLLADPNGGVSFARRFALCGEQERRQLVWSNEHGTPEKFSSLLRDLVLCQNFWDQVPYNTRLTVRTSSLEIILFSLIPDLGREEDDIEFPLSAVEKLWQWFMMLNSEAVSRFCVQDWMRRDGLEFEIFVDFPTAHERLEAHLRWRDWLVSIGEAQ